MAKGANTARIGAFVILGLALIVAAITVLGGGRFFRESRQLVMNFTASMQGLGRGSPVMFSGVPIGEVTDVVLRLNEQTLTTESAVLVNIYPDRFAQDRGQARLDDAMFAELVDRGLRARLVPTSIVTGQLGIELGFYPGSPIRLTGSKPGLREIPTIPSTVERLETTVQKILTVMEGADLEALSANVEQTLEAVRSLATAPELKQMIQEAAGAVTDLRVALAQVKTDLPATMSSLRRTAEGAQGLVSDAQRMLPGLRADLQKVGPALDKIDTFLGSADEVMRNVNAVASPNSQMQLQLANTLRELSRTSAAVRSLATALEDNPNSILFGALKGASE